MAMATPLDVRLGLTSADGAAHPLRWGFLGAGPISADFAKCLLRVPGAALAAVGGPSAAINSGGPGGGPVGPLGTSSRTPRLLST
jgi:hypothetical protein